jgi:hypothetical protein
MTPAHQTPEPRYLCEGGPLHGEWHDEGEAFEFDGRPVGLGYGVYRLLGDVYSWEPAGPAAIKLHEPPADE